MKFRAIEPNRGEFVTEIADLMIDWAQKNNLTVRGKMFSLRHIDLFHISSNYVIQINNFKTSLYSIIFSFTNNLYL